MSEEIAATEPDRKTVRRQRIATILVVLGSLPMLLGLVDPLEGMLAVAVGGILVLIAAFMRKSGARWVVVAGLGVLLAAFAAMTAAGAGALPRFIMSWTIVPWLLGGLLIIAGDIWLIRQMLAGKRPRAANIVAVALVLLVVLASVRIGRALGEYKPGDVPMSERASAERGDVKLVLMFEDTRGYPIGTDAAYWGAGILENTSASPVSLPPNTTIDVVVKDESGKVVFDGAEWFYSGDKTVMPWDRPTVLPPGGRTEQKWELHFDKPGTYHVSAVVKNSPFAGLETEGTTVTATPPPSE